MFVYRFVLAGVLASTTILWLGSLFGDRVHFFGFGVPLATSNGIFRALVTLVSIAGAPAAGFLSDWLGKRWPVVGVTSILGGLGLWMMSQPFLAISITGGFLSQITGGSIGSLVPAISGDGIDKARQGRALGIIYTLGDFGSTLGPPIALGLLNTGKVSIHWIYQNCALVFLLLGFFSWGRARLEKSRKKTV